MLRDIWGNGQETTRHAYGFEQAEVANTQRYGPTTIKGTSEANWIRAWGPGPSTIDGREGDDEILGLSCRVCGYHVMLVGGPGDDSLTGGRKIIGGPGDDVADGGPGFDRCYAEVRLHCEA
jgi:Ca2+-binding RTX toxin-like protein